MTLRCLGAITALLLLDGQAARAETTYQALLEELNGTPAIVAPVQDAPRASFRMLSNSKRFSLVLPEPGASGSPRPMSPVPTASRWNRVNTANPAYSRFDLHALHYPEGSWIKGHVGRRSRDGMRGVLRAEEAYAKQLIEYSPDEVLVDVSLETYRASALYCGRLRGSGARNCCSLVHVALHGSETVRLHSLIVASTPLQRDVILREFASVMSTLTLHP